MAFVNYYQTLQVKQDATQAEIAAAYRGLARRFHPDLNPAPDAHRQMQVINEAYNTLRHPERRRRYDEMLAPPVPSVPEPGAARTAPPPATGSRPHSAAAWLSYQKRIGGEIVFTIGHADTMAVLLADLQRRIPPAGRRYDITHNHWHVAVEYEDVLRTLFRNYAPVVQSVTPAPQSARRTSTVHFQRAAHTRHRAERKAWSGMALAVAAAVTVYALIFSRMVLSDVTAATPEPVVTESVARTVRAVVTPAVETEGSLAFPADCASAQAAMTPTYFQEACKTLDAQVELVTPASMRTFALTATRVASNIRSGPDTRFPVLTTAPPGTRLQLAGYTVSRGYVWFLTNFGGWVRSDLLMEAPMYLPLVGRELGRQGDK